MSKDNRDNKVRAILLAAAEPLGPTEIARRINEDWCGGGRYPSSSAITPVCRRIGAVASNGKYSLQQSTASGANIAIMKSDQVQQEL